MAHPQGLVRALVVVGMHPAVDRFLDRGQRLERRHLMAELFAQGAVKAFDRARGLGERGLVSRWLAVVKAEHTARALGTATTEEVTANRRCMGTSRCLSGTCADPASGAIQQTGHALLSRDFTPTRGDTLAVHWPSAAGIEQEVNWKVSRTR